MRSEREGRSREMYGDRFYVMEDRVLREQDLAERVAERKDTPGLPTSPPCGPVSHAASSLWRSPRRGRRPGRWSGRSWRRRGACRGNPVGAPFRRRRCEMKALELRRVEKSFKKRRGEVVRALDSVSLAVGRGEVVGILGPNGSGKSTLVRVISTLVVPDEGSVEVFGVDAVRHPKEVQRSMNRVSVEASFFKKLSAMENLLYGAKLYGVTSGEARPRIKEILENIGFAQKRALEPMEHLSRGMQQKVALARALLTSPILMLLDEPD